MLKTINLTALALRQKLATSSRDHLGHSDIKIRINPDPPITFVIASVRYSTVVYVAVFVDF